MVRGDQARLFGVLGDPVEHSCSPAMHNAAFAAAGLSHLYLRYRVPVSALPAALAEARTLAMGGLNLTVPLKEAALPLVDTLTPEAARIGAVNTVVFRRDGSMLGDNTDSRGFLAAVSGQTHLHGGTAVVIGAGGSARAVAVALQRGGIHRLVVANRTPARAVALADRLVHLGIRRVAPVGLAALVRGDTLRDAALVVNTTPLGLAGAQLAIRYTAAPRACLFVDLVYGAQRTPFLAAAARAGYRTLDGSAMLLHQGAFAFEAWTGQPAPRTAMAKALRAAGLPLTGLVTAATSGNPRPSVP